MKPDVKGKGKSSEENPPAPHGPLKEAITTLIAKLGMTPKNNEPIIFVAFDEAHFLSGTLQDDEGKPTTTSYMTELRRNLEIIRAMPVFTLFLSTTGKISSLVSSYGPDISARILAGSLKLMPAFSDLGYDQLMLEDQVGEKTHTLETVANTRFMARFGRPMYAISDIFYLLLILYTGGDCV